MASEHAEEEEEEDFNQTLTRIGGRGHVYLVCECKHKVLQDFIRDVFPDDAALGNGDTKPPRDVHVSDVCASVREEEEEEEKRMKSRTVSTSAVVPGGGKGRRVRCAVVVFLFGQEFLHGGGKEEEEEEEMMMMKVMEILKDVRCRTACRGAPLALIGLVRADRVSEESRECVGRLDLAIRSVFSKNPPDSIWTGHFVGEDLDGVQEIRRQVCRTVRCSQVAAADRTESSYGSFCWPLRMLVGRGRRGRPDPPANSLPKKGDPENTEEGIPLQTKSALQS